MVGNRNAAKPAEARVSEARIAVSVGTMLPKIDAAAEAAGLSRAAWCRQAIEDALARQ